MALSKETVSWAYALLGAPSSTQDSAALAAQTSWHELRLLHHIVNAPGFKRDGRREFYFDPALDPRNPDYDLKLRLAAGSAYSTKPTREDILWAYRLFLGREPESDAVIEHHVAGCRNRAELARRMIHSKEFKQGPRYQKLASVAPFSDQVELAFADLPNACFASEAARHIPGVLRFPLSQEKHLSKLRINFHGGLDPKSLVGVELNLGSITSMSIHISNSHQKVTIGKNCAGQWDFAMRGNCAVNIGDNCSANGAMCMLNAGCFLNIGSDCMFAQTYIHVGDNHAIFDLGSMALLNVKPRTEISIGNHVWLASRCTILSDVTIGEGSIVAACSVVTKNVPRCCLVGGTPARVLRRNVSWTRCEFGSGMEAVAKALDASTADAA